MAKKNFKGGLDSLIENSLGMRKSSKKGELKGNPVDLVQPEQTTSDEENNAPATKPEKKANPPAKEIETSKPESNNGATENGADNSSKAAATENAPKANTEAEIVNTQEDSKNPEPNQQDDDEQEYIIKTPTIEIQPDDTETNAYLKQLITDLRKELALWRNGKLNPQIFNTSLSNHGLKYNPFTNEIEEI